MPHITLLLPLLWLRTAHNQNLTLDKAQVQTGYLYNLAVPLAYRGSPTLKTLTFTPKTQHRRTWPQPSPLASRCGFSPLSFFGEGPGVRPPITSLSKPFFNMKKQFIITLPLLLGRACPVLRSGAGVGLLLLAFAYAMLLPACHKDPPDPPVPPPAVLPDTLPPLTTVGANTFGCYVNGKLWLPKADWKAYFDPSYQMFAAWLKEGNPPKGGYIDVMYSVEGIRQLFSFGVPCKTGILHTNIPNADDPDDFSVYYLDFQNNRRYYPDRSGINRLVAVGSLKRGKNALFPPDCVFFM